MKKHQKDEGFTLVEIAIVLVIVGLLISLGAALLGPLTKKTKMTESREVVKTARDAFLGFVVKNGFLPREEAVATPPCINASCQVGTTCDPFCEVGVRRSDSWGSNLMYYAADEIEGAGRNACGVNTTAMQVNDCQSGTCVTKTNVAYVIYSLGADVNGECTGTTSPYTVRLQDFGYDAGCVPNPTNPQFRYDDIVQYISLDEIRAAMGCAQPLAITSPTTLLQGEEDSFYSYSLQAIGGRSPYTWQAWSGSGLTLNTASGLISGTINYKTSAPNAGELSNCTETINVTTSVTDQASSPAVNYTGTIQVRPKPLAIVTQSLPSGIEGSSYASTTLSGSGGRSSYTWSISSGTLPTGLVLNASTGVISGTTTTAGTYNFVVQLADTCSTTQRNFAVTVNPPGSSTSSTGSTSSSSSSSSGGGPIPTCTLTASPTEILKGQTSTLTWSITNGPANGSFSPASGTCTTFSGSSGGSCTTAALTASTSTTFTLTVSNASGSSTCSATVNTAYRVWNNTGARWDFRVDGTCRRVANGSEITAAPLLLGTGETISRYNTNNGTCGGAVVAQLLYATAATADADNDSQVNFTGTDR